ncbi:ENOS interacting protein [Hypoxylon sp. FL1150]|nr:ENOS interacting protein [Hypoxylon sp. FL1150]
MSHSKRNTSRAVFTSYERDLARRAWGSTSARLSRESFLPFSSCALCLEVARDPVSCVHGDVFCRECALANILAQKKEIRRLEKAREREDRDREEDEARREEEARERAVRAFERTQIGLDGDVRASRDRDSKGGDKKNGTATGKEKREKRESNSSSSSSSSSSTPVVGVDTPHAAGKKRKFEIDDEELARIAAEDRAKARKAIDDEKAARPTLPSFWTPSVTPASNTKDALHEVVRKTKSTPVCPASREENPHTYSLHTLVTVNFTEEEDGEEGGGGKKNHIRVCPSCKKGLSNSSRAMLAKPCGHVLCRNCVDKFMKPSRHRHNDPHAPANESERVRCYVCEADLTEKKSDAKGEKGKKKDKEKIRPGLVELTSEGTGFSAGGANQVQKSGIAFQC